MSQDAMKKAAAEAALVYVQPGMIVGIGTGSTANHFIDLLVGIKHKVEATVASSIASANRLEAHGFRVLDLNAVGQLSLYVDGADESNEDLHLVKGGGGALTREKIVAGASDKFVCIADDSKLVQTLGKFPLPLEVIPMAQALIAREMVKLGGKPVVRAGFTTDNGNIIIDVHGLEITDAVAMENHLNQIPGIVTNGLFALRPADVLILAGANGVRTLV